ncbi:MAG: KH domain-containing protein [Dehalococcoidia bacterium]
MKDLIEYIAKSIVDKPEEVKVTEEPTEDGVVLRLEVAPEDTGKVIGKEGRIANAMRTLLRVAAIRKGTRATLEIISDESGSSPRSV